jgi:hypothetical protein
VVWEETLETTSSLGIGSWPSALGSTHIVSIDSYENKEVNIRLQIMKRT